MWLVGWVHLTAWIFIWVLFTTLLVERLLLVFLLLEYAWPDTFYIFLSIFCPGPLRTAWGCDTPISPPFSWGSLSHSLGTYLVLPGYHSLASSDCFSRGSTQLIMFVLGNHFLVCQHNVLVILLRDLLGYPWGSYLLEDLFVLIKALAKLGKINFIPIRISYDHHIGCLKWYSVISQSEKNINEVNIFRLVKEVTILLCSHFILRLIQVMMYLTWIYGTFSNRTIFGNMLQSL